MKWLNIGKTVESFGSEREPVFVLYNEADAKKPLRRFTNLKDLADAIKSSKEQPTDDEARFIKNDLPSIVWLPDDTLADTYLECERLSKQDVHELALLLRK